MNILLRIVLAILLVATGLVASDSAEYLEYILVDAHWSNWFLSPYISRILTGSSMVLGFLILIGVGNRTLIYKLALALSGGMLLLSILQPFVLGLTRCYACMSEIEKISRYQGVVIWAIAFILLFILLKRSHTPKGWQLPKWSAWVVMVVLLPIPFILNYPAHWAIYGESPEIEMNRDLNLARLDTVKVLPGMGEIPTNITSGRKLICLASLTCPFCSRLAYKLHIIRKGNPDFPVVMILTGEETALPTFLKRSRVDNVPYFLMNNELMHELCEGRVPRIFLLQDGIAVKEINYWALTPSSI
jgi:hypothetical protein